MIVETRSLEQWIQASHAQKELHPRLKKMVLRAAEAALRQVVPDNYHEKCHAGAIAVFEILRSLGIRCQICGGTVSWLFGGVDAAGTAWQTRCGFWSPNPNLPTPHAWVVTEFGGIVDLTCSYFHQTFADSLTACRTHDVIPRIWMKADCLGSLPGVQYAPVARYSRVDLDRCDELARQVVAAAVAAFRAEAEGPANGDADEPPVLDGLASLEELRRVNAWVARNSRSPSFQALSKPPGP